MAVFLSILNKHEIRAFQLLDLFTRTKAKQFAAAFGNQDFKTSLDWLNAFKNKNYISFKAVCGESYELNIQGADEWEKTFKRNYSR